jgi:hypothetical protein
MVYIEQGLSILVFCSPWVVLLVYVWLTIAVAKITCCLITSFRLQYTVNVTWHRQLPLVIWLSFVSFCENYCAIRCVLPNHIIN